MISKTPFLILILLGVGLLYRVVLTWNGNFIFNVDNADDMVDVREMVLLRKPRLIGQVAGGIEGLYYGPFWFYMLAIPFILSNGDPYASIIFQFILWFIGGFFLLKLLQKSVLAMLMAGSLWIASDYIVLSSLLALNPSSVVFLTPVFVYSLCRYVKEGRLIFNLIAWFLGGLFLHLEMAFGLFTPVIIIVTTLISNRKLLKTLVFWSGPLIFILSIFPQIIFDFRHNFILSKSIFQHFANNFSGNSSLPLVIKLESVGKTYYAVISGVLMNNKILIWSLIAAFILTVCIYHKKTLSASLSTFRTSLLVIAIPLVGQILLPNNIMLWYLVAMAAVIPIILGYCVLLLSQEKNPLFLLGVLVTFLTVTLSIKNISKNFQQPILLADPALLKNELAVIDYVYQSAKGNNFKVYTYTPSVYDYPYQYLFWWYGQRKYGYLPKDYAYQPSKPEYIRNKEKFDKGGYPLNNSDLMFLIKESDSLEKIKLWEKPFARLPLLSSSNIGPVEIEIRKDIDLTKTF